MRQSAEAMEMEECRLVTLQVDHQLFGIPVQHVRDVLKTAKLTKVPLADAEVLGVMNLRGRIVTVIDVRALLQLTSTPMNNAPMFIIVERKGEYLALVVDAVGEVLTIPTNSIEKKPSNLKPAWRDIASGVHRLPNELLVIIDMDTFLVPHRSEEGHSACVA